MSVHLVPHKSGVHLVPHRSGVHRVAAIALFRALLTQCRAIDLEAPQRDELQNIVRNRFKQSRHDHGLARVRLMFDAGYEAIDQLDSAIAGDEASKSRVLEVLGMASKKTRLPPQVKLPAKLQKELDKKKKREARENRGPRIDLFKDRPLPLEKLSGRRHVPVLFSAGGPLAIPMLRLKKPQPPEISGYISNQIMRHQGLIDRRSRLTESLELAKLEDQWDTIIEKETSQTADGISQEEGWTAEIRSGIDRTFELMEKAKERNMHMADKMRELVAKEQALADEERKAEDEERAEIKKAVQAARNARRQARKDEEEKKGEEEKKSEEEKEG